MEWIYFFAAIGIFGILFVVPAQLACATRMMTRNKVNKLICYIPVVNEIFTDVKYMGHIAIMSITKIFFILSAGATALLFLTAATSTAFVICKWVLLIAIIASYLGKVITVYRYLNDLQVWSTSTCIIYGIFYFVGISAIKGMAPLISGGTNNDKSK